MGWEFRYRQFMLDFTAGIANLIIPAKRPRAYPYRRCAAQVWDRKTIRRCYILGGERHFPKQPASDTAVPRIRSTPIFRTYLTFTVYQHATPCTQTGQCRTVLFTINVCFHFVSGL